MKLIFVNNKNASKAKIFDFNSLAHIGIASVILGIPMSLGLFIGHKVTDLKWENLFQNTLVEMEVQIANQQDNVDAQKEELEDSLNAMTVKLAQLRYRIVRLDALGEELTNVAEIDQREFSFSQEPGLGGPNRLNTDRSVSNPINIDRYSEKFADLEHAVLGQETQLNVLKSILADKYLRSEQTIAGTPVRRGWMSSDYGMRTDPFHGKRQWHAGVDFAGRKGDDIVSIGSGVITYSGVKSGYGLMVEITHNDGFVTRYAHNDKNVVELGSTVKKGQVIAKMGSSGRSTGPHVHLEVHKNGRTVDPSSYINRTIR